MIKIILKKPCRYSESIRKSLKTLIAEVKVSLTSENLKRNAPNPGKLTNRGNRTASADDAKRVKFMEKRHSAIRKTVCDRSENENVDEDDELNSTLSRGKNTKPDMFGKNNLYRVMCIYCSQKLKPKESMVLHYRRNHSDREVPISRMSPEMVQRLRFQNDTFEKDDFKKTSGFCYFCEENHKFLKFGWQSHLITHTGEKMFNCTQCHAEWETKKQHDKMPCRNNIEHVVKSNENGLFGFMCNDCNYFQFSRDHLISHLKNEHGYENPVEPNNFKEFVVVKNV